MKRITKYEIDKEQTDKISPQEKESSFKKLGVVFKRKMSNDEFSQIPINPISNDVFLKNKKKSKLGLTAKEAVENMQRNLGATIYSKTFIGIDNGVSGAITILSNDNVILLHEKTPVKKCLNYTKKKAFHNRVDFKELEGILHAAGTDAFCMIERPMINPGRWVASVSAMRCLEATEILLEELQIPYQFIDSKEWQRELLPSGLIKDELKIAADSVAKRLFPKQHIVNADSILIAEYCLRKSTNRNLKPSKK
jgi:hypothetical protein